MAIALTAADYVDYLLGDAGVEQAIAAGDIESSVREYCRVGVEPVFGAGMRAVLFEVLIAYVQPQERGPASQRGAMFGSRTKGA